MISYQKTVFITSLTHAIPYIEYNSLLTYLLNFVHLLTYLLNNLTKLTYMATHIYNSVHGHLCSDIVFLPVSRQAITWPHTASSIGSLEKPPVQFGYHCKCFRSRKYIWKSHLQNVSHFISSHRSIIALRAWLFEVNTSYYVISAYNSSDQQSE